MRSTPTLTRTERDFLDESAALAEAEARATEEQVRQERRSNRRLRLGLAAVAALLAVAIVAGTLAKAAADRADQETTRAERQTLAADARRLGAEALRSPAPDLALLLAVAGTRLDDSPDTRNNLSAVLGRSPELIGVSRVDHPIGLAVRPDGGAVAVTGWDIGVTLVSTETGKELARNHDIPFIGVKFNPNGTQLAVAVNVFMASGERRVDPIPVRMLDPQTAALTRTQLGGQPQGRVVHGQLSFSNNGRWLAAGYIHPTELDEDTWFRVWDTGNLPARQRRSPSPSSSTASPSAMTARGSTPGRANRSTPWTWPRAARSGLRPAAVTSPSVPTVRLWPWRGNGRSRCWTRND